MGYPELFSFSASNNVLPPKTISIPKYSTKAETKPLAVGVSLSCSLLVSCLLRQEVSWSETSELDQFFT